MVGYKKMKEQDELQIKNLIEVPKTRDWYEEMKYQCIGLDLNYEIVPLSEVDNQVGYEMTTDPFDDVIFLKELMKLLSPRESEVVVKYYGLFDTVKLTLQEIGEEIDLTRERVRQINSSALKKMKSLLGSEELSNV